MSKKRPYSLQFTARANPRRYLLSGIPPTLWDRARARAKRENLALRTIILSLVEQWTDRPDDAPLVLQPVEPDPPLSAEELAVAAREIVRVLERRASDRKLTGT